MLITGAKKTNPMRDKFWDFLPYTRIVGWGRDFENLRLYFINNLFESAGLLTKKAKAAGIRGISLRGWASDQP